MCVVESALVGVPGWDGGDAGGRRVRHGLVAARAALWSLSRRAAVLQERRAPAALPSARSPAPPLLVCSAPSLSSSPTRAGASECSFARRLPSSSQRSPGLCRPSRPPSGREAGAPGEAPPVRQSREESERRERESRCPGSRVSETCWSPDAAKSRPKTGRPLPIGCQESRVGAEKEK